MAAENAVMYSRLKKVTYALRFHNLNSPCMRISSNIDVYEPSEDISHFSSCAINLARNKNICGRLKKVVAKSRATDFRFAARFHWTHNLSHNKCCHIRSTPSKSSNQCAAFLQHATNVFVAGQVDHARWKKGNINKNLQRNNVARQVEDFCIS